MKCNLKTMIKIGIGVSALLAAVYVLLPASRVLLVGSAPILLALICPLSMLFMMKSMNASNAASPMDSRQTENPPVVEKTLAN